MTSNDNRVCHTGLMRRFLYLIMVKLHLSLTRERNKIVFVCITMSRREIFQLNHILNSTIFEMSKIHTYINLLYLLSDIF